MSHQAAQNIPEGFHTITPYLINENVRDVIAFLQYVFDAEVKSLTPHPEYSDKVMNAEVRIGNSMIMMADTREDVPLFPAILYVYVDDVDAAYARALEKGVYGFNG
ncbi:VOC family protein [Luteithermobacter gelatinilyticus]|uniref:VOC family protein n=1 Tax=Luteithermobacter gelatinilyticus TaxID=2582913 RepID=UPI001106A873|nr:hypothetical protein [Luteithermobacter gelatinilyticus]